MLFVELATEFTLRQSSLFSDFLYGLTNYFALLSIDCLFHAPILGAKKVVPKLGTIYNSLNENDK